MSGNLTSQEYSKIHSIYYATALSLVDDLDQTAYGDLDTGFNVVGRSKNEQREALTVLSEIIADEIGGPSLDLYGEEDRNIIYESDDLMVAKPGSYEFEFGDHKVKIGDQAVKKWNVLYQLSQGDSLRDAVNENFSGSSPLSSQNMSDWEEKMLDENGRLPEKYRSGLETVLRQLHEDDKISVNSFSEGELNLDAIRRPYARPGIIDAVRSHDSNFFDSSILNSRRSNWKIGQHMSDLVTLGVLESRGSKYAVADKENLEAVDSHVREVYEDIILDTLEEFDTDQVVKDIGGKGLVTVEKNDGSKKLIKRKEDDYSGQSIDFLEDLGAIDDSEGSRIILADDEDLEHIERVLSDQDIESQALLEENS